MSANSTVRKEQKCSFSCINTIADNKRVEMYYYTYAFLREDRTPYYIGKGKDNRAYRRRNKGEIKPPKDKSRTLILKKNLTEQEAFRHEVYMITVFGRKDLGTGILRNRTNGGEGVSGLVHTDKSRKKMSKASKGNSNFKGKKHTEESKRKNSEAHKGKILSEEHRRKVGEAFKGKILSEEHKRRISEGKKGKNKDKKWWNDGCGNRKIMIECPGDGWVLGMR